MSAHQLMVMPKEIGNVHDYGHVYTQFKNKFVCRFVGSVAVVVSAWSVSVVSVVQVHSQYT